MKTDRLIGILTILLQKKKITTSELAERFEVSRRTICRDIDALCEAGIPVTTMQGFGGGVSITEGYRIDSGFFTEKERLAILAGLKGLRSVSDTSDLQTLLEKLSGTSSEEWLLLDLSSFDTATLTHKINTIQNAIRNGRQISFQYSYQKGDCFRTVEPYRLIFQWSSWYVLGYCLRRADFRLFKLSRLWEIETGPAFSKREIPAQALRFDRYFDAKPFHLKALFQPPARYRLIEEYGPAGFTVWTDGRLLLERDFVSFENMREWILSFGALAEVLAPESLRNDLRQHAETLLQQYRKT